MKEDLLNKLNTQPDPPCVKFACGHREECAAQQLACSAFAHYYQSGEVKHPNWDFPQRATALAQPIWRDRVLPSRRIWLLIEADDWGTNAVADKPLDELVDQALEGRSNRRSVDHWLAAGVARARQTLRRANGR